MFASDQADIGGKGLQPVSNKPLPTLSTLKIGGGGSHPRTRLRLGIPCSAGKYREIFPLEAGDGDAARCFQPIPLKSEQGISLTEQGIVRGLTGNTSVKS